MRYTLRFQSRLWWNRVLDVLYPDDRPRCALCQRLVQPTTGDGVRVDVGAGPGGIRLCLSCLQDARMGAPCRRLVRIGNRPLPVVCPAVHEGLIRHAIRQWKYDGALELTAWLADHVARSVASTLPVQKLEVVVPVPTTRARLQQRGYHPVLLLAEAVAEQLGLPLRQALGRYDGTGPAATAGTRSQTARTAAQRRQSLEGVFYVVFGADVTGRLVLLVDDVVTTGSTMAACAERLLAAGARQVFAAGVAMAE